jgi:hypothetical protein
MRRVRSTLVGLVVLACATPIAAQWIDYKLSTTPRLPDGRPDMTAPAPRAADGRPDLTGIWEVVGDTSMPTDGRVRSKYLYNIAADRPGGAPFQPWARALWQERQRAQGVGAPSESCLPHSIPSAMLTRTLPFKFVQGPGLTIILFEEFNNWRQVFTDGRPQPVDPQPAWVGYSVGRWDGDTFVVETSGFNDRSWLDAGGTPHSEALKTTERFRRVDFGHLEAEFVFDDSKAFTTTWSATARFELLPDTDLFEHHCDNQKWVAKPQH